MTDSQHDDQSHFDTQAQEQVDRMDAESYEPVLKSMRYVGKVGDLRRAIARAYLEFTPIERSTQGVHAKYAPLHNLVASTQPALSKEEVLVEQCMHAPPGGDCCITMVVSLGDDCIELDWWFKGATDMQELGTQTTYLRRYQYNSYFKLDAVQDADSSDKATRSGASQGASRPPSSHRGQAPSVRTRPSQGQQRPPVCNADTMATVKKSLRSAGLNTRGEVKEWAALHVGLSRPMDEWTTAEAENVITHLVDLQSAQAQAQAENEVNS